MNDVGRVQVLDSAEQVVDYCLDVLDLKVDGALYHFLKVALCEFEHHVEAVELLLILRL